MFLPQKTFTCLLLLFAAAILYMRFQPKSELCITQAESTISWIETIKNNQWKIYSQSGEDGILDTILKNIGTTNKVYVEFGVGDGIGQLNTKYLRENGWDMKNSLLMDGGFSNPDINLEQVFFWPSNIVSLFQKFGMKMEFDFLSVDTDSYEWFMIEAILEAGYRPRVICTEINPRFDMNDAKTILPPTDGKSWQRWDESAYHGSSILALSYLFNRFGYSMVFCNYVNCFAISDEALGLYIRRPLSAVFVQNVNGEAGWMPACDFSNRSLAIIHPSGKWMGEDDGGQGSPTIRHSGCPNVTWLVDIYSPTFESLESKEGWNYKC